MSDEKKLNELNENTEENTQGEDLLDFDDDDPLGATEVSKKSLVIFFLIDTSGSMRGKKMGELNTVMEELIPEIRRVGEADTDVKIAEALHLSRERIRQIRNKIQQILIKAKLINHM